MVRRGRRSTAGTNRVAKMTATRFKKRALCLVISVIFVMRIQPMALALDAAALANYADGSAVSVGRTAHEPKFGERLLPLRKKNLSALKVGAMASASTMPPPIPQSPSPSSTEKNVNNPFKQNTNNYIVSHEISANKIHNNMTEQNEDALVLDQDFYTATVTIPDEDDGDGSTVKTEQSKMLNRREDINIIESTLGESTKFAKTSNISKADRLVVMSTEFFIVPTSSTTSTPTTNSPIRPKSRGMLPGREMMPPPPLPPTTPSIRPVLVIAPKNVQQSNNASVTPPTVLSTQQSLTGLRKEPWVVPVLVLASLTMFMMGAFEIFVLFKAWRTSPSRRHLFLGQMLLLGLFACAGLGAIITAQPSLLSCGTIRFGVGVSYALVFAALLVKCVFLISLNGGVYLPAPYQGLLLLFAVLIQVAIGAQWLLTQPPELYTINVPIVGSSLLSTSLSSNSIASSSSGFAALLHTSPHPAVAGGDLYTRFAAAGTTLIPLCNTQFSELLLSLIYIFFLIVFVAVLAIKSRGIRDNYREATYIGLAIGGAIPIWLGWMLCGLAVAERHKDACIAFGLIATSATVFLVMFMPKGRQLAAMGKEGLYVEDREEQFSSLSRAGSGYSPSFFHFKPLKYGVMSGGGMQSSATNAGNGANMKHCSNAINGGDRVALVTAAPPSYTRMYHYYPAHLTTHPFCFYPQPPPIPPPPPPAPMTQLPSPPTLKQLGNTLTSITQAHIAQTLRYPGLFIRPDETNLYTTLEPTLSSNPNVYFQRGGAVHPGMMY